MSTKIYLFLKQHNNLLDNELKDFLNIALLQLNKNEYLELLSVLITCKIDLSEFSLISSTVPLLLSLYNLREAKSLKSQMFYTCHFP